MTVQQLANNLHTSEADIRKWAEEFHENSERIEGVEIPRIIENYVRTKHLQATHPEIYKILARVHDPNLAYERWVVVTNRKIKGGE